MSTVQISSVETHQSEVSPATLANVDNEGLVPGDDDVAWPSTVDVRHRRTRSTQPDMESILDPGESVAAEVLFDPALE